MAAGKKGKGNKRGEQDNAPSPVDRLVQFARKEGALFRNADGIAYFSVLMNCRLETWTVASSAFKDWLTCRFLGDTQRAPSMDALQTALNTLGAIARAQKEACPVYTRVASIEAEGQEKLYLDAGDTERHVIEVTAAGWQAVESSPVRFCRSKIMRPLPLPKEGGSIGALRGFLNVASDEDFVLCVCWLLYVMRGRGPFPHLALYGGDSCAKTTTAKVLASLIDPVDEPSKPPRNEEDLMIAATKTHLLVYDNISKLPDWLSDAFCRLSTGDRLSKRKQYSDGDEFSVSAKRPAILTGIEQFVTRADLGSRCLTLTLPPMPTQNRQPEKSLWSEFESARGGIMGALLNGLVGGLRRQARLCPARLPRMADFYLWGMACETAFWPVGTFERAYWANVKEGDSAQVETNPLLRLLLEFMDRERWEGTTEELRDELRTLNGEGGCVNELKSPEALAGGLNRVKTTLGRWGIRFERLDPEARRRPIRLLRVAPEDAAHPELMQQAPTAPTTRAELSGNDSRDGHANTTAIPMPLSQRDLGANDGCDGSSSLLGGKEKREERDGEGEKGARATVTTVTPPSVAAANCPAGNGVHGAVLSVLPRDRELALSRDQVATHPAILLRRHRQCEIRDGLRDLVRSGAAGRTPNAVPRFWRP